MFCHNCGSKITDGAVYCQNCGTKVLYNNGEQQVQDKDKETEEKHITREAVSAPSVPNVNSTAFYGSGKRYGDTIKPYYCEQFDRIKAGQKTKFNWAAFFFNGWNQLFNGCSRVFCRTFLPVTIIGFVINLVSILSILQFNFALASAASAFGVLWGVCSFALCIINGFKFNTWYYQDVINNPGRKRSKKGLVILVVSELAVCLVMYMLPFILQPSYEDLASDDTSSMQTGDIEPAESYTDEEEKNSFQQSGEGKHADSRVENVSDAINPQDIETAKQIIYEWFERHPLKQDIRVRYTNERIDIESDSGIYLKYELYMVQGELGVLCVDPYTGNMIMDSITDAFGNRKTVQISLEQWYLEYYWRWTDHSGYEAEQIGDDLYVVCDETGAELFEYNSSADSYTICNWDIQCNVEYDGGSAEYALGTQILDIIGIYGYDESFEVEGQSVDFYYSLEVAWDDPYMVITETWRGNTILQEWVSPDSWTGNILIFYVLDENGTGYEKHSLSYLPAEDSPLGQDTVYLDGNEDMPFVRE